MLHLGAERDEQREEPRQAGIADGSEPGLVIPVALERLDEERRQLILFHRLRMRQAGGGGARRSARSESGRELRQNGPGP